MRDLIPAQAYQQTLDGVLRKRRCGGCEHLHPLGGSRKGVALENALKVDAVAFRIPGRLKAGVAVLDAAPVSHAAED